ncbi:sensor histidine kinase [Halomonas denitrificans]|nr:GAF domain-containing sensor histidine kinase [Halomonas denitrificans]
MTEQPARTPHLRDRERLQSLAETGLLDTPERAALDRYARIATRALKAPVSLVSLVDDDRQFFAAAHGLDGHFAEQRETPLSHSFCQIVVNERQALVVTDARNDERVCDNLAIADLNAAAYAGVPLCDSKGNVLGSFCVIDEHPRDWTRGELDLLSLLAEEVAEEIELARRIWVAENAEADLAEINQEIAAAHQRAADHNAAVMHDLRTPLQVVSVAVRSLSDHPAVKGSTALTKSVEMLERNARQAFDLVRSGGGPVVENDLFTPVDAARIVERVCKDLEEGTSTDIECSLESADVLAEPMMIQRAVQNLVSNALRFARSRIAVEVALREGMVGIVVEDDGDGLPNAEDYARVWDLGRRFHGTRSNTGLGLAVTRQLIQALGGSVRARPSDLGGARFELWLPEAPGDS